MFKRMLIFLAMCSLLVTVPALAGDDDEVRQITIVDDEGNEHVISLSGTSIEVVTEADGEVSVHAFDFEGLEPLMEDVVASVSMELDDVMSELEDLDLNISIDGDMVVVEQGESVHAVNVQFLSETVGELLGGVLADFDGGVHVHIDENEDDFDVETKALQAEVRALKKELRLLTEELSRQR